MQIRPRTPGDLPALTVGLRAVHDAVDYPSLWPEDPVAFVTVRGEAWVAVVEGQLAGQVVLSPLPDPPPAWVAASRLAGPLQEVKRLFVVPGVQGGGVGRALLLRAQREAQAAGATAVLQVNERSLPAVRLYERAGWRFLTRSPASWQEADGLQAWVRVYAAPGRD
ncbi:GNAT family N-acetyltransferase [Deinococcus taeanensis]|uniref:GNAT family N-acetyltransferase n=1 Tax=Deinococcus taeanensis TaxID=2737050 RepID=UPI001CDD3CDC|nr:GNAT family N-acetyltransferase [Deinococcus taeanensis]UBV41934.1 GNAT family N-acetyltransferase [Deinococcus taeanensis]